MKLFLRGLIFGYLAIFVSQVFAKSFITFDDKTYWMVVFAVALLNIFKGSILELLSLPSKGIFFQLISAFLTVVLLNVLVVILPNFRFLETKTLSFTLLGHVVTSTYLPAFWGGVLTGVTISLVSNFFFWLSSKK
jgi:hypothetical protein